MAQIKPDRQQFESAFMSAFWKFRKEVGEPEKSDSYWDALVKKADALAEQFGRDPYTDSMIVLCVDELDIRGTQMFGSNYPKSKDLFLETVNRLRRKRGLPELTEKKK